ncbi:glycosyltransferase [Holophaga foetida]|uniref:glycosyltransferase n=1 Tax=Holophaga foetida TaxID=35839 RepID=UPI00024717CA|nr:glycosyltransferase [Holophaga foetida]
MLRFLIVPSNNSLSHLGKALALEEALVRRGHKVLVAVGEAHAPRLRAMGRRAAVLPDIQEADGGGFPTPAWFRNPEHIRACVLAERQLLREFRPDRALGIFRFTLGLSARMEGIPCDSLICACMLPESPEVLGFAADEPGLEEQRAMLQTFYRYAGSRLSRSLGLEPLADIRSLLHGERTFLWDVPEFAPLPELPQVKRVGPLSWRGWPPSPLDLEALRKGPEPLAVLSFGTCVGSAEVAEQVIGALRRLGYRVLVAAGGQEALLEGPPDPGVIRAAMAPMHQILPMASLMVCHGGQMTVFEALGHRVPVLVIPFQPEQAQNGVALERIGCGGRLVPPTPYVFSQGVYLRALGGLGPKGLERAIRERLETPGLAGSLARFQGILASSPGVAGICEGLEGPP